METYNTQHCGCLCRIWPYYNIPCTETDPRYKMYILKDIPGYLQDCSRLFYVNANKIFTIIVPQVWTFDDIN